MGRGYGAWGADVTTRLLAVVAEVEPQQSVAVVGGRAQSFVRLPPEDMSRGAGGRRGRRVAAVGEREAGVVVQRQATLLVLPRHGCDADTTQT